MAKDDENNTPPRCYDKAARAAIKAHIEKVAAQRKITRNTLDSDAVCERLEFAATMYNQCIAQLVKDKPLIQGAPQAKARETLDLLTGCVTTIGKLRRYLTNPALFGWDFASLDGLRRTIKSEASSEHLIQELPNLHNDMESDARELQKVIKGAKMHAVDVGDCEAWLIGQIRDICHQLFGPQVGRADGPLVTFMHLGLKPVLGEAIPPRETLRTIARRE